MKERLTILKQEVARLDDEIEKHSEEIEKLRTIKDVLQQEIE